jgi:hypothetical protein
VRGIRGIAICESPSDYRLRAKKLLNQTIGHDISNGADKAHWISPRSKITATILISAHNSDSVSLHDRVRASCGVMEITG